ncbi:hypothetical protein [Kitasatospora mediocidica]
MLSDSEFAAAKQRVLGL